MLKESPNIQQWLQIIREKRTVYRIHAGSKKSKTDASRIALLLSEEFLKLDTEMKAIHFVPYLEAALYESALEGRLQCDELERERDGRGGKIPDALKLHSSCQPNDLSRQLSGIAMKIFTDQQEEMKNGREGIKTKQLRIAGLRPRRLSARKFRAGAYSREESHGILRNIENAAS